MKQNVFFLKSSLRNRVITLFCIFVCFFSVTIATNTTSIFASTEISNAIGTVRLNQDHFEISPSSPGLVKVYGSVTNGGPSDKVTIIFTMPDGDTQGSQLFPTKDGFFETFLLLDDNSQRGIYTVFVSIRATPMGSLTFSVTQEQFTVKSTIPSLPVPQFVESIILTTDKNSYSGMDKIKISGEVKVLLPQTAVALQILSPNGNMVAINQVNVDADGKFYNEITTGGQLWKSQGTYTIKAFYGSNARTAETTFYFDGTTFTQTKPPLASGPAGPLSGSPAKTTYYDTQMSLQVQDGTTHGYIKVKPTLTYSSGTKLSTKDISIYVDGKFKTKVSSNLLSSNIYAATGSHIIKASVAEFPNTFDSSIRYKASSDTETYDISVISQPAPGSPFSSPSVRSQSSDSFLIEYVIVGVAIVAVATGVGIALSQRKKVAPMIYASPAKVPMTPANIPVAPTADDTQFWVCPRCGSDTEMYQGKQYCRSCNTYLN